jgi:hypothetical protein
MFKTNIKNPRLPIIYSFYAMVDKVQILFDHFVNLELLLHPLR